MPGYTHMQRAQPVSMGFHMLAHGNSLLRDVRRLRAAYRAADVSALGAGALAGNTLGLDPALAATQLRFSTVFDNAMDAVSDRDFVLDLVYAAATCECTCPDSLKGSCCGPRRSLASWLSPTNGRPARA